MRTADCWLFFVALMLWQSCASKLARQPHTRRPFSGQVLNLELLTFIDLETQQPINASQYLNQLNKDYLLLMFGSVGCTKCNEKAKDLSQNYLSKHQLFITEKSKLFQLVGVNTDTGGAKKRFDAIFNDQAKRHEYGYEFVKWWDESGTIAKSHLITADQKFGVPLTVMLNRQGIIWQINNQQHISVEEILQLVDQTISGKTIDQSKLNPDKSNPDPANPLPPVVNPQQPTTNYGFDDPNRLDHIKLQSCSGATLSLQDIFKDHEIRFIQLIRNQCDDHCQKNIADLKMLPNHCSKFQKQCLAVHLSVEDLSAGNCQLGIEFKGGEQFFKPEYQALFNWQYDPVVDQSGIPVSISEIKGPLIFGFNQNGTLIYLAEGRINSLEAIITELNNRDFKDQALTSDFKLFGDVYTGEQQEFSFADWRKKAKYSVVTGFDIECGSCVEELAHFSLEKDQSGEAQLVSYCAQSQGFCQILAVEKYPIPKEHSARSFWSKIMTDVAELAKDPQHPLVIKVPLAVDTQKFGDFSRFFESYLEPLHPGWQGLPGTVIYDWEGKMIASFPSVSDPQDSKVLDTIKHLRSQSHGN